MECSSRKRRVAAPPTQEDIDNAHDALVNAETKLHEARADVHACAHRERITREKLARAITQWQSGFPQYTPDQLLRDHAKAEPCEHACQCRRDMAREFARARQFHDGREQF